MDLNSSWTQADFSRQGRIAGKQLKQLKRALGQGFLKPPIPPVFASFISLMKLYVDASRPLSFLDCACTSGYYLDVIQTALPHLIHYTGSDLAPGAIELARVRHPNTPWHVADVTALPFKNKEFDIVMAAGVLEHVPKWPEALSEIARVAGQMIILHRLPISPTGRHMDGQIEMYGVPTSRFSFAYHDLVSRLTNLNFVLINGVDTYGTHELPEQTILFRHATTL